ncbi:MAG TPA: (2Fe-2S)-binding protein [Chloroflexota bacterium]|nr:(2Fe-2S)-binding protein [Chloroflexota bacterium]
MVRTLKRSTAVSQIFAPVAGPGPVPVTLRVNGQVHRLGLEPRRSLLDALRLGLGLTGAKRVCNLGECGACTVLIDDEPIYSCLTLALECQGRAVTTIEGLAADGTLDPVQDAFVGCDAVQCGFCTPGQVLAAKALLDDHPDPTDEQIRRGMAGNLCRCGTYTHIVEAIRSLGDGRSGGRVGEAESGQGDQADAGPAARSLRRSCAREAADRRSPGPDLPPLTPASHLGGRR